MDELVSVLENGRMAKGLSTIEINSIIRAKNMYGKSPKYTVEELSVVFEYYQRCIVEINKYKKFPPTKKNFCAFCGISTNVYDSWMKSVDEDRAELMKMVDDYISDTMLISAQTKEIDNITTMFRAKAEHSMIEANAPVVVEHKTEVNMEQIKAQIAALNKGKSLKTIELDKQNYTVDD